MRGKGVYIHIPFCKTICTYCDFCKLYADEKWINNYLTSLKKEVQDNYMDDEISTIYIGGGTPSILNEKQLTKLFNIIKLFKKDKVEEITFECNLNDINEDLIKILVKNKVNRISIGIESFNKENLKLMGRDANFNDALNNINLIKSYGIDNINVDLIYALPEQTIKELKKDLRLFKKLKVNHISTYSLMIEKNTVLYNNGINPINEDIDYKMYNLICSYLKKNKYVHYEISNFAKKGYESKHNLTYWNNNEYYGFGLGASGYVDGIRYDNTRNLTEYLKGNYRINNEILSIEDKMKYEVILGFRRLKGINVKEFYNKYKVNIQNAFKIKPLLDSKDLIYKDGYLFINPKKIYIQNEILLKLL